MNLVSNNILYLRLYGILTEAVFVVSVIVAYYSNHKGLSMTEFMFAMSTFAITMTLIEIPSGYLADRFGRRNILIFAVAIMVVSDIGILLGYGFLWITICHIVMTVGMSMRSGAESAILYDSLLQEGRTKEYSKLHHSKLILFNRPHVYLNKRYSDSLFITCFIDLIHIISKYFHRTLIIKTL